MIAFIHDYLQSRRRRSDWRSLNEMDDYMLADIGMTRADVANMLGLNNPIELKRKH
jgi:uncharacterized protein YjiS (DUF1127 family)